MLALTDEIFFDKIFDLGFDYIQNLTQFMTDYDCHGQFKEPFEKVKKEMGEALGVPEGILEVGEQLYNDILKKLENLIVKVLSKKNEQTQSKPVNNTNNKNRNIPIFW